MCGIFKRNSKHSSKPSRSNQQPVHGVDMSTPRKQKDLVILLIGPSGSGKSSFVQSLTRETVPVSHDKPCTRTCTAYKVNPNIDGHHKSFILIDTPGFVDSPDRNIKILENIARAIPAVAPNGIFGAIYFHNIAEMRLKGSSVSVLDVLKAMCGRDFYPHIAFVTTMWDGISEAVHKKFQITNDELEKGPMKLTKGSPGIFKRLRNDEDSCKGVLRHFSHLAREIPAAPRLHILKEMQVEGRNIANTAAGHRILKDDRSGPTSACCVIL